MASEQTTITVPGPNGEREMRISSPSRVLWPELGLTKLDLARYMVAVGEAFIAANGDRPVVPAAVPGQRRRRAVLLEEPAEGRPGLRAVGEGDLSRARARIRSSSSTSPPPPSGRCR